MVNILSKVINGITIIIIHNLFDVEDLAWINRVVLHHALTRKRWVARVFMTHPAAGG